jgi:dioxygenase
LLPINPFSEALLNAAIDEGVRYFATVGDVDSIVFKKIKENNGVIIHRPLNPNSENMREVESLGVDLLVATGYDEGGIIPSQ